MGMIPKFEINEDNQGRMFNQCILNGIDCIAGFSVVYVKSLAHQWQFAPQKNLKMKMRKVLFDFVRISKMFLKS